MMQPQPVKTNRTRPLSASEAEPFVKRWFCVAATGSGATTRQDAEAGRGFNEILKDAAVAWVDLRTDDFEKEAPAAAAEMGFGEQLVSCFAGDSRVTYQDFDTEMGLKLPSVQVRFLDVNPYPLLMLIKRNFILTIHPLTVDRRFNRLRRYADTVLRKIPVAASPQDKLTILLTRIIDENNERNFEHLREIEERGDELNAHLLDPMAMRERLGPQIYEMKHALLIYLDALWETVNVIHALRYGDAELITDDTKLLDRIGVMGGEVNTQIGLAEHMSDVLASGLEVLQSIYNNQLQVLNNRLALVMTYFTIIGSAVLVPNTLATILGNTAFALNPADRGWYIALLVAATILPALFTWLWVKKAGLIPKKME
ncbi:MAG: magnesium transporter CorA [Chloroflexi bacterium]|nr:magnesium transporter CorA [Chloroflexota bacterium]